MKMIFEYHLKDSEERDHLDIVEEGVGAACAKALWQEGAWDQEREEADVSGRAREGEGGGAAS